MRPTTFLFALLSFLATDVRADDPVVTIALDRSNLPWKVTVSNHGPNPLVYETIEGTPRNLGIEHWEGFSGSRLYVDEMAHRISEMRIAPVYGQIEVGDTRTFELDPREVSSTSETELSSWKANYEEFKFYEIRIFFEQFASPLIFEPNKKHGKQTDLRKP